MTTPTQSNFISKKLTKGTPVSTNGLADSINDMSRAVSSLQVEGDSKIDASISWVMGIPKIKIRWKG